MHKWRWVNTISGGTHELKSYLRKVDMLRIIKSINKTWREESSVISRRVLRAADKDNAEDKSRRR